MVSQEDIDRGARALCVMDGADPDGLIAYAKTGHRVSVAEWYRYRAQAQAVLTAASRASQVQS